MRFSNVQIWICNYFQPHFSIFQSSIMLTDPSEAVHQMHSTKFHKYYITVRINIQNTKVSQRVYGKKSQNILLVFTFSISIRILKTHFILWCFSFGFLKIQVSMHSASGLMKLSILITKGITFGYLVQIILLTMINNMRLLLDCVQPYLRIRRNG